jgi:hypothetical protein
MQETEVNVCIPVYQTRLKALELLNVSVLLYYSLFNAVYIYLKSKLFYDIDLLQGKKEAV